jgi:guanylate kinase
VNKPRTLNSGILFVVSAPSGTGKTTVVTDYLKGARGIARTVSHTTRSPRPGESKGVDYHFVNEARFRRMIREGRFVEWAEVYGKLYGTSWKAIRHAVRSGDVILVIDGQGGRSIRKRFTNAVFVVILPPSLAVLRKRIFGRSGRSNADALRRLRAAKKEATGLAWYDYVIVNDRLPKSVRELSAIVDAERRRLARHPSILKPFEK